MRFDRVETVNKTIGVLHWENLILNYCFSEEDAFEYSTDNFRKRTANLK
jgi:hypothetical protein